MSEDILCFTRKGRSQARGSKITDLICVPTHNYDDAFVRKYGQVNGNPGNFYFDYEPPANAVRLRDLAGNLVRKNAEKTVALNEFFVDLFTKTGDLVIDMFAGTASMAMRKINACLLWNRN